MSRTTEIMLDEKFIKHFFRLSALCYRMGALDAHDEDDETRVPSFEYTMRKPDSFGLYGKEPVNWIRWRLMLLNWFPVKGSLSDMLYAINSLNDAESAYLRIFQEMYVAGVKDYYSCAYPPRRDDIAATRAMFLFVNSKMKTLNRKQFLSKIIACVYERIESDKKMEELYGSQRKAKALPKARYERIIMALWATVNTKMPFYD